MMALRRIEPCATNKPNTEQSDPVAVGSQIKLVCDVLYGVRENKALLCCTAYRYGG